MCRRSGTARQQTRGQGRYLGIGFAAFSERTGYGTPAFAARGMGVTLGWETVELAMDPSGWVEVRIGASPHGQGLRTTIAQLVADELGLAPDRIRVVHGDTDRTPYGWGTFASRSLVIAGGASVLAARKVRAKLKKIASHLMETAADDIVLKTVSRASPARTGRCRSRRSRVLRITRFISSRARSIRRSARLRPTIRPARSRMPATPASSRWTRRPDGSRSSGSSSLRMPAGWSIR